MTNELARIFGFEDDKKLRAMIETYVSLFGEKYRKHIEQVVYNAHFIVCGASKGEMLVDDYISTAESKIYEYNGLTFTDLDEYVDFILLEQDIDEQTKAEIKALNYYAEGFKDKIYNDVFWECQDSINGFFDITEDGKVRCKGKFDKDIDCVVDFGTCEDLLTEDIDLLIEISQNPPQRVIEIIKKHKPFLEDITKEEETFLIDEIFATLELCKHADLNLHEIKAKPALVSKAIETVKTKLKQFQDKIQIEEEKIKKAVETQRAQLIMEYRKKHNISEEEVRERKVELTAMIKASKQEERKRAQLIKNSPIYARALHFGEEGVELPPEILENELACAQKILEEVKKLYPNCADCTLNEIIYIGRKIWEDGFNDIFAYADDAHWLAKRPIWQMLNIPEEFVIAHSSEFADLLNIITDKMGESFLEEKDFDGNCLIQEPWIVDAIKTLKQIGHGAINIKADVVEDSTEKNLAAGKCCTLEGTTESVILLDIQSVSDSVTLHEGIHALGHQIKNGTTVSGFNQKGRAFNEILTEWLTQKCIKKLIQDGNYIFGTHNHVASYSFGFSMFDSLFTAYFEELVECIMVDIDKVYEIFTQDELKELMRCAEVCLDTGSSVVKRLRVILKNTLNYAIEGYNNLTATDTKFIAEHVEDIKEECSKEEFEFIQAVADAYELTTKLIQRKYGVQDGTGV